MYIKIKKVFGVIYICIKNFINFWYYVYKYYERLGRCFVYIWLNGENV